MTRITVIVYSSEVCWAEGAERLKNPLSFGRLRFQGYFGEVYPELAEGFYFASV
jgi:hypothetical protein